MPVPALPPLPPRSATEIVDGAVQLIRPQFGYFLRIAAIGAIPALVQSVATLLVFPEAAKETTELLRQQLYLAPLTLLTWVFATAQSGAIVTGAMAVLRGDALPTVWQAFTSAFRRVFALLGANLLLVLLLVIVLVPIVLVAGFVAAAGGATAGALAGGGTAAAIGIGIAAVAILALMVFVATLVFARSALLTALVVVEELGPFKAFSRSQALSQGSYLQLAKTYGLVLVISMVIYGVLAAIALAFQDKQQVVQALLSVLLIPIVPIFGAITLLTYADLRIRREGADLDAELSALSAAPVPPL